MKIEIQHEFSTSAGAIIVPLAKQAELKETISFIAGKTGLSAALLHTDFSAEAKEMQVVYFQTEEQPKRLILLGLGEEPSIQTIITAFRRLVFKNKSRLPLHLAISFLHAPAEIRWIEAASNGIALGLYDIGLYKTEEKTPAAFDLDKLDLELLVPRDLQPIAKRTALRGFAIGQTQCEIFDLVNAPANKKTPQELARWAVASGQQHGYSVTLFDCPQLESMGMMALLAVNRGSEHPPVLIVMEYKPDGKALRKIGLVGKGVTFDTGGLNIKPSTNLFYMKSDMGGAAAVLGAMETAAKLRLPVHLVAVVPATENSVDGLSTRPGDVIGSYSGKTIEVIDTDAEGRLVVADALSFLIKNHQPDIVIDLATLTGSTIRTLGTQAGGLFSNNDELAEALLNIGYQTGERLWRLPLWKEYLDELKSDIADLKNLSSSPTAGAITAAKFLECFIEDHSAWAHLDIAGVTITDSEFSRQKSATAFGVRLLTEYFMGFSNLP